MGERKSPALSQSILRLLCDRSYEKRKEGALELEDFVKGLMATQKADPMIFQDQIVNIVREVTQRFIQSDITNHRKGGLIALPSMAVALVDQAAEYVEIFLPPVLKSFEDPDSSCRYCACEALYNIAKVTRSEMLFYFNEIFSALCKLSADPSQEVRAAAEVLNCLLKDIVTESMDKFNLENWIPELRERLKIHDVYIRNLIIGWVRLLHAAPEIPMLDYLPEYMEGLFDMLGSKNRNLVQEVSGALDDFLSTIDSSPYLSVYPMVPILVNFCDLSRNNKLARSVSLSWLFVFIRLDGDSLRELLPDMVRSALTSLPSKNADLRAKASACNDALIELVANTKQEIDCGALLKQLAYHLISKFVQARMAALSWFLMLMKKMPSFIVSRLDTLLPVLLRILQDSYDQVVRKDIEVLARLCYNQDEHKLDQENFRLVLDHIVQEFSRDRRLLNKRGSLIVRQLCLLLDGEAIYRALAATLRARDPSFVSMIVQTLNLILLTSPELYSFRNTLRNSLVTDDGCALLKALYRTWCHNPLSTFSLCLFAQAYELATAVIFQVSLADVRFFALRWSLFFLSAFCSGECVMRCLLA